MIVDSSAIIAILHNESDSQAYADAMSCAARLRISAATLFEVSIVVDKAQNPVLSRLLDTFVRDANIVVEPVTEAQVRIARDAYRDFGRGSGHPAGLNFGDCFAYALAKEIGEPLLFKGDDFSQTDIPSALTT